MISKFERKIPELLAPAGSKEALSAVLEAGADSVYVAGKLFGMRQHAAWLNFAEAEMEEAIRIVHDWGKKIYVTVNNLLTGAELELVERYLDDLRRESPDAVIVQDLGLLRLCHEREFPIPIHASTMMNVHDIETAQFLAEFGVARIIASRDITLGRAVALQEASGVEFEVFLHGDMCIAHSGQCLTSGILAGESPNRGKCLKPCRWQYELVLLEAVYEPLPNPHAGAYLLARKDLSLLERLAEVAGSGIAALKIEGRARKPEYLQYIVSTYRRALDTYAEDPAGFQSAQLDLAQWEAKRIRNLSTCYTFGNPGADTIDYSGEREPRFFSLAIEQAGIAPESAPVSSPAPIAGPLPTLVVHCSNTAMARRAVESGADRVRLPAELILCEETERNLEDLAEGARNRADLGIFFDRVLTPQDWRSAPKILERSRSLGVTHAMANTPALAPLLGEYGLKFAGDFGLNVMNADALDFLLGCGCELVTVSLEATLDQVMEMAGSHGQYLECVVHGSLPGMLMEHCVVNASLGKNREVGACRDLCAHRRYGLKDPMGQVHPVLTDRNCRNQIMLPKDLCALSILPRLCHVGISSFRIEGRCMEPDDLPAIVSCYRKVLEAVLGGEELNWEFDEDWRRVVNSSPRGFSLCSYGNRTQDVAVAGESLPTNLWLTHSQSLPASYSLVETLSDA